MPPYALRPMPALSASGDGSGTGRAALIVLLAWLATVVVEGPLRAGLAALGLPNALYARDLVAGGTVAWMLAAPFVSGARFPPGLAPMAWLLAVHLCIGMLIGGTAFQRLFGLKMFVPMLYGAAACAAVRSHPRLFRHAMALFFGVSVLGVFLNQAIGVWPWEGMSYETAFGFSSTTRTWWMNNGLRRLPGFAQASFDAAMVIGLCGTVLLACANSFAARLLVAALGLTAIAMTTSKGMVLAYAIAALWLTFSNRSAGSLAFGRCVAVGLLALTCAVPALFMVWHVPEQADDVPALLASLWDRFSWMWPSAYALMPDGWGALTGIGPGGIGGALDRELSVPNSADSIFVYYFVTFGVLGIAYLAFPALAMRGSVDADRYAWTGLLLIAYGYGLSINMVEQPFFAVVFGLLYGVAFGGAGQREGADRCAPA